MKVFKYVLFMAILSSCGAGGGGLSLPSVNVSGSAGSGASLLGLHEEENSLLDRGLYELKTEGSATTQESVLLADSGINVSELWIKPVQFWVSTSALCTNPVKVYDAGSLSEAVERDFTNIPPIADGTISPGTYPCLIMVMSDQVRFKPASNSTSGNCVSTTMVTLDVCNTASGATYELPDGTTGTCSGGLTSSQVEQTVAVYISTGSSATTSSSTNAFRAPTSVGDTTRGMNLGSSLVIGGTTARTTFVADTTGKVSDNGTSCDMQAPNWSFQ